MPPKVVLTSCGL